MIIFLHNNLHNIKEQKNHYIPLEYKITKPVQKNLLISWLQGASGYKSTTV